MGRTQPLQPGDTDPKHRPREKQFAAREQQNQRQSAYCECNDHRPVECSKVDDVGKRKKILSARRRCFNCTRDGVEPTNAS